MVAGVVRTNIDAVVAVMRSFAAPGGVPLAKWQTKGRTLVLTCGDASVTVVISPGAGIKSWGTDGTTYQLKTYELRIYRGEFTTEPDDIDPLFVFSQSFGNRNGQGEAMACSDRAYNPDHNATAFEYVTVTSKS